MLMSNRAQSMRKPSTARSQSELEKCVEKCFQIDVKKMIRERWNMIKTMRRTEPLRTA